jgi:anaerobic dimethyl sulfoxide reductase subunit A
MNKVIDSLYESKSIFEIACELAPKLGISDYSDKTEEEWIEDIVKGCKYIPDYAQLKKEGVYRTKASPWVAFEKRIKNLSKSPFPTPSGKIEIYSNMLAERGHPNLPAIPKYIETWESLNDPLFKKYPLQLITNRSRRRAHSQFDNIPWVSETETHAIRINSVDAQARGIRDGENVKVFNDRGEMIIPAKVTEIIMPGVVEIPQGAWYNPDKNGIDTGGCANTLTRDEPTPGGGYVTNTCLVQVEKLLS